MGQEKIILLFLLICITAYTELLKSLFEVGILPINNAKKIKYY